MFNHTLSDKVLMGLGLSVLISRAAPDFKNMETSAPEILNAVA